MKVKLDKKINGFTLLKEIKKILKKEGPFLTYIPIKFHQKVFIHETDKKISSFSVKVLCLFKHCVGKLHFVCPIDLLGKS